MDQAQIVQLLGIIYLGAGLGILFNPKFYKKMLNEYMDDAPVIYINSLLIIIAGYLMVAFRSYWPSGWGTFVTVIGWIALVKGFMGLVTPNLFVKLGKKYVKMGFLNLQSWIIIIGGLILVYAGYFLL